MLDLECWDVHDQLKEFKASDAVSFSLTKRDTKIAKNEKNNELVNKN